MTRRHSIDGPSHGGPMFDPLPPGYSGHIPEQPKKPTPKPKPKRRPAKDTGSLPITPDEPVPFIVDTPDGQPGQPKMVAVSDASAKIRTFEQNLGGRHEDDWSRTPNTTGTGAIHVKSFHAKLTGDSLNFLDQQINEWLDDHPQYEVKLVTTSIGTWTGKLKEPNLIVNVWV